MMKSFQSRFDRNAMQLKRQINLIMKRALSLSPPLLFYIFTCYACLQFENTRQKAAGRALAGI